MPNAGTTAYPKLQRYSKVRLTISLNRVFRSRAGVKLNT